MNPRRSAAPCRWLGRSLTVAALAAASLAVSACGGSSAAPTILNTEKLERAIESSSLAQRGQHAQVSCPSGVHQKKGLGFSCTAVVGRASTRFAVTQLDGSGRVHYAAK
jgi:hypothetical protein